MTDFRTREQLEAFLRSEAGADRPCFMLTDVPGVSDVSGLFNLMTEYVRTGELSLSWHISCPVCGVTSPGLHACGHPVTAENLIPVFRLTDDYRSYIRKDEMNEQSDDQ